MENKELISYKSPACKAVEIVLNNVILALSDGIEAGGENGDGEYD